MRFGKFNATSIQCELGQFYPVMDALYSFIASFNGISRDLSVQPTLLHERYLEKLYQFGVKKHYKDADGLFEGIIYGVEKSGKLIVQKNDQNVSYDLKELVFL